MNQVICEICEQPGGDPCSGLHLTENECICALMASLAKLKADIQEQAVCVWHESPGSSCVCLLCEEGIGGENVTEEQEMTWTDEQWRAACPHTDDCAARRE